MAGYGQSMAQQYPGTPLAAAGGPYAASLRGYYPPGAQEAAAAAGYSRPVEMLASGTPSPPSDSSLTMTEFVVPGDAVARIIGSRGNTVREIQEMSGTKIDVINDAPASAPHRRVGRHRSSPPPLSNTALFMPFSLSICVCS